MQNPEKEIIKRYFEQNHGEYLTAADLEEVLGIDFWACDRICEELVEEKKIR